MGNAAVLNGKAILIEDGQFHQTIVECITPRPDNGVDAFCLEVKFLHYRLPQTFTRVRSTTFVDSGYAFTITDDYDVTTTTAHEPLAVRIRNDDDVSHAILIDVENPYADLTLGFIGSGSVDQVMTLAPGQIFSTQLRVFPQDTEREFYTLTLRLENDAGDVDRVPLVIRVQQPHVELDIQVLEIDPRTLVTRAQV